MKKITLQLMLLVMFNGSLFAQQAIDSVQIIDEVVIEAQRISIPFSEKSHTISILTASEIMQMPATSLEETLQLIPGIDIRRRGVKGMQSDLYIRGGNFNQTLLLIDGIKLDDMQTGHHTMNGMIDLDNIERIEIIKGASARIYGQNAMNGAINIVTKNIKNDKIKLSINAGSFDNYGSSVSYQKTLKEASVQFQVKKQKSKGYRFNTDFDNWSAFFKTNWNNYELLATYAQRDFGANGFYASPEYKDQYEETQTNLIALKRKFSVDNWKINSSFHWRRNQDMYLFLRHDPEYYRNLHVNNKVGITVDASVKSKIGITGIGVDMNQGFLTSNNLGDHKRLSTTVFVEHKIKLFENKLDITPGVALANYTDFKSFIYPGIDIGYRFSNYIKAYVNSGYTNRIPTYTNLYYQSAIESGNSDLKPERALTTEGGVHVTYGDLRINTNAFSRKSTNLIDWTKEVETDKWQAQNIGEVNTNGFETEANYSLKFKRYTQHISLGYSLLDDSIKDKDIPFSRYSLNSYKHQFSGNLRTQLFSFLKQSVSYRYSERINGENYHLIDIAMTSHFKKWELGFKANNILNIEYTETNLVPMPKFNFIAEVSYSF